MQQRKIVVRNTICPSNCGVANFSERQMQVPLNACQHAYDVGVPLPNGSIAAISIGNIVEARRKQSQVEIWCITCDR